MNMMWSTLAVVLLVCSCNAVPGRRKHRRGDGDFVNFQDVASPFSGASFDQHSSSKLASPFVAAAPIPEPAPSSSGYGTDGFSPLLADPPCLWTQWSDCDSECQGGIQIRFRRLTDECPYGPDQQVRPCNTQPCAQDCILAEWGEWNGGCSECSVPCGGGIRSRTRAVTTPALFGGQCRQSTVQTESCNEQPCPVDCIVSGLWTTWGACSAECGGGVRTRSRQTEFVTVVREGPSQSAAECPGSLEEESCNIAECVIDCAVSAQWSEWSACTVTCGNDGQQTRSREIVIFPQNGGELCPETMETRLCSEGGIQLPECNFVPQFSQLPKPIKQFQSPPKPIIITPPQAIVPPIRQSKPFFAPPKQFSNPIVNIPQPVQSALPPVDPNFCLNRADGPYAHPACSCCNDLIMCFQRRPIVKWCPAQQIFSSSFGRCVSRSQAGC